jgi:CDGSH-type Zn-finger protein
MSADGPSRKEARREALRRAAAQGPALVRGVDVVVGADGVATLARRPVVALCRCDASTRLPWCDGTHKRLA